MIPKIVHSFWFGRGPLPPLAVKCMEGWRRALPGYEIKIWDEATFDVDATRFTREAYRAKKYAFVSDYARLDVLRRFGGIYLDVDVEVRKPFTPLLEHGMFLGFMYDCNLGTAVIGAHPRHPLLDQLLDGYEHASDMTPNNDVFTSYFLTAYTNFRLNNTRQEFDGVVIYPKEYFEFPTFWGDGGYSVHHFMGSWWRDRGLSERIKSAAKVIAGRPGYWILRNLTHRRALRHSPFRERYLADRGV